MLQGRIAPDFRAHLIAVHAGHHYINQGNIGHKLPGLVQRCITIVRYGKLVIVVGEDYPYDLLNGDAVIGEEQFIAHLSLLLRRSLEVWKAAPGAA
jgi:hypothetical protein